MDRPLVLIADDDTVMLDLCVDFLTEEGYHVLVAQTGEETLQQATTHRPDAVLLDILLPGRSLDGVETCRRLKADRRTAQVPVALISGQRDLAEYQARAGADAVLPKPFDLDALLALLQALIARPPAEDPA